MKSLRRAGRLCAAMQVGFALGFVFVATGRGQEAAGFTEVTPNVLVFATRTGNVVALVGPDGALLIGTPSADSTERDRKSTRLNSSHITISYAVFCLKKKK